MNVFFKGKPDPELITILTVKDKYEADIAAELLSKEGIPCLVRDHEDCGQWLRAVGWGSPFGMDILVGRNLEEKAREVTARFREDYDTLISEEELTELALESTDDKNESGSDGA